MLSMGELCVPGARVQLSGRYIQLFTFEPTQIVRDECIAEKYVPLRYYCIGGNNVVILVGGGYLHWIQRHV